MKKYLIASLLGISACYYTLKVDPIPVVLSWGGITPDKNLVKVARPDGGPPKVGCSLRSRRRCVVLDFRNRLRRKMPVMIISGCLHKDRN